MHGRRRDDESVVAGQGFSDPDWSVLGFPPQVLDEIGDFIGRGRRAAPWPGGAVKQPGITVSAPAGVPLGQALAGDVRFSGDVGDRTPRVHP